MSIYHDHILDHYHTPRNHGSLSDATHSSCADNPTCGDSICIDFVVKGDHIVDVAFSGEGCAISQAAASLLTEHVLHKDVAILKKMTKDDMLSILGLSLSPARLKCGLLALETAQKAINDKS